MIERQFIVTPDHTEMSDKMNHPII